MNDSMRRIFHMRKDKHIDCVMNILLQRYKLLRMQTSWVHLGQWTTYCGVYTVLSRSEIMALSRNPEYPQTLGVGNSFPV